MAAGLSDLVLDAKLDTEFSSGSVRHTLYVAGALVRQRRVRITETWDIGPSLGRGSYGNVRLETCQPSPSSSSQSTPRLRAVKVIHKAGPNQPRWDYLKELEAVIKFSNERYAPYFVRTHGWFESSESIFITLEYFPLGDLRGLMRSSPPFGENGAQQIIRQLVDGIKLMHDCGFAHRDLKPGNILVEATTPELLIKIADFGISKRVQENGTDLRTMEVGTFGYMSPEVLGFFSGNDASVAYSVTVDIWAIGIIAFELLLKKHPFVSIKDMLDYVNGARPLSSEVGSLSHLSHDCRHFLEAVLSPNPVFRPTAGSVSSYSWIAVAATPVSDEDSLFVAEHPLESPGQMMVAATPASLAWSSVQGTASTQSTGTLLSSYQGHRLDTEILLPCFRHLSLETTKYFVLRSNNELDVETSIAHGVWTSSQRVNKIIEKGYTKTDGQVVLFFSVIKSRKFCGVAQMTSRMDWANTDEHWLEDVWQGRFTMDWLCLNEVSFDAVKHVPVSPRTPGFRAIACYDGTEIAASSAFELLRAFAPHAE